MLGVRGQLAGRPSGVREIYDQSDNQAAGVGDWGRGTPLIPNSWRIRGTQRNPVSKK